MCADLDNINHECWFRMALKALRKESDKVNYLYSSTLIIPYINNTIYVKLSE